TPVQNDMDELFNLVTLLKPGQLHTYDRFLERYVASPDRRVPMRVAELRGRLRDVMVRNRRGIAFTLPPRRVHSLAVRLSHAERRLYADVTEFVRDAYWSASGRLPWTARLTLMVLQREIGSSTFPVSETLGRLAQSPLFRADERERLEALRQDAAAISSNVKADRLCAFLKSVDEKVLVFTQYRRTLLHLLEVLEADGYRVAAYHGGLSSAAKDAAVRTFREDRSIFLSTEAGGAGAVCTGQGDQRSGPGRDGRGGVRVSDAPPLRTFVLEALRDLGASLSDGESLVWVQAPETVQRDLEVPANFALAFDAERSRE